MTIISAPAGSGKTSLLRAWADRPGQPHRLALVQVQRDQHDAQQFWLALLDAVRHATGANSGTELPVATPDFNGDAMVDRVLSELADAHGGVTLVIDDLHELHSPEAPTQLTRLLTSLPPNVHAILTTRHDVRLRLHRLRLAGELSEIRAADLRFTERETRELLNASGITLPEAGVALLHQRTEGWAAGLRLAAISLAGNPDPERFVAEFSGSDRTVAEYLLAEMLDRQPPDVQDLLLRTSLLDRVNGELADLLTGDSGGERILQQLEEAGAFVISLDARRSWFRYHQLFADLLQLELRGSAAAELPALHDAAAGWYAGHGYPIEAVRQAQAAQNWALAARVLSDQWIGLGLAGRGSTAHELLGRFPDAVIAGDAELAARVATDRLARGPVQEAERYLALAARALDSVPADRHARAQVVLAVARMRLARQRGDLPAVAEEAHRLLAPAMTAGSAEPALGGDLRALALINLGAAEVWSGRFEDADRHLADGIDLARKIGRPYLEVAGLANEAQLMSWRSFPAGAQRSQQAIELATRHGWADEPVAGVAYLALGVAMVTQGRTEEAERALGQAERTLRTEADPAAGMRLVYGRGMLEFISGRHAAALRAFQTAERLAESVVSPHTLAPRLRSHLLQTLVRTGETRRAEQALAGLDAPERDRGEIRIAEASLRLAQDDPKAATAVLAPVIDGSVPLQNAHLWEVQAFLLQAVACDALGDASAARRALERALDRAEPERLLFPFLYDPAPDLLDRHRRQGTAHAGLIAGILTALAGREPGSPPAGPPRLREPLSHAEARVLRYLPTKLSAPEIADELYLSVNTVKTHMRHLYDKLGAHRRHEAVEQARALGLLARKPINHTGG